jgi:hypothetical protein
MHTEVMQYLYQTHERVDFHGPVLEIGSIDINGSAREVYGYLKPYVGVDIVAGPNVDVVYDIRNGISTDAEIHHWLNLPFHTIICTEVLEHVDPETLIPAFWQFMHGRCHVVITCATTMRKTHSADGAPELKPGEYYKNVNMHDLRRLLEATPSHITCNVVSIIWNADKTDLYAFAEYDVEE